MGKMQMNKGNEGEVSFGFQLECRGWDVARTRNGVKGEDFFGTSPDGTKFSIEVKNNKILKYEECLKQARDQAAQRTNCEYMLAWRVPRRPETFVVFTRKTIEVW